MPDYREFLTTECWAKEVVLYLEIPTLPMYFVGQGCFLTCDLDSAGTWCFGDIHHIEGSRLAEKNCYLLFFWPSIHWKVLGLCCRLNHQILHQYHFCILEIFASSLIIYLRRLWPSKYFIIVSVFTIIMN